MAVITIVQEMSLMALDPVGQEKTLEESQGLFLHLGHSPSDGTSKSREHKQGRGMETTNQVLLVQILTQETKTLGQISVDRSALGNGDLLQARKKKEGEEDGRGWGVPLV